MNDLEHRRALLELGQRAVSYYIDTGLCVFCAADDCEGIPHDDHCNVGELSGVVVTPARIAAKADQRAIFDRWMATRLAQEGKPA